MSCYNYNSYVCGDSRRIKGVLSGQTQFLATERPLKNMKNAFYFTSKALSVLKLLKSSKVVQKFSKSLHCSSVERVWKSWKMRLWMLNCAVFVIYAKTVFGRSSDLKSCYILWLINFNDINKIMRTWKPQLN